MTILKAVLGSVGIVAIALILLMIISKLIADSFSAIIF